MHERRKPLAEEVVINDVFVFRGMEGKIIAPYATHLGIVDDCQPEEVLFDATISRFDLELYPFEQRKLERWTAPRRPITSTRLGLGRQACDKALYAGSGTWTVVGQRDAEIMVEAMRVGFGRS